MSIVMLVEFHDEVVCTGQFSRYSRLRELCKSVGLYYRKILTTLSNFFFFLNDPPPPKFPPLPPHPPLPIKGGGGEAEGKANWRPPFGGAAPPGNFKRSRGQNCGGAPP